MTIIAHKFCKIIIPRSEYTVMERAKGAVKFKIDDARREFRTHYCVSVCVFRSVVGGTRSKFEMRRRFLSVLRRFVWLWSRRIFPKQRIHLHQLDAAVRATNLLFVVNLLRQD